MVKNLPAIAGGAGSIIGSGRSPGGRHGNPLQYSSLENSMDRGASVHGVAESYTTEQLNTKAQGNEYVGVYPHNGIAYNILKLTLCATCMKMH